MNFANMGFTTNDIIPACLESTCPIRATGRVTDVVGLVVEAHGPVSCLGTVCDIYSKQSNHKITAEVSGFKNNNVLLMPLEEILGIGPGCRVVARQQKAVVPVGRVCWVVSLMALEIQLTARDR